MPVWQVIPPKVYFGRQGVSCMLFKRLQRIEICKFYLSSLLNRELLIINISKTLCIQGNSINSIEQKS